MSRKIIFLSIRQAAAAAMTRRRILWGLAVLCATVLFGLIVSLVGFFGPEVQYFAAAVMLIIVGVVGFGGVTIIFAGMFGLLGE
jgi:hypothetical protein